MRLADVNERAVRAALEQMGETFQTKDLSEHEIMLKAHGAVRDDGQYHSVVGRFLSQHGARFGVVFVSQSGGARGAIWRKSRA